AATLDQLANTTPAGGTVVRSLSATLSVNFLDCQQLSPCLAVVQVTSDVQVQLTTAMNVAPQIVPVALMRALLERLLDTNENATTAMSRILDTWSVLAAKQAAFLDDLHRAEGRRLGGILQQLDVQQAGRAWNQLAAFARTMTQ